MSYNQKKSYYEFASKYISPTKKLSKNYILPIRIIHLHINIICISILNKNRM